jgi:putative N6-adenine-specific DNA methylase
MRDKCQRRPDSGGENIGAAVFIYWERNEAIIYLDTSGEPLSKRGYRKIPGSAPMQETLAAACIMAMEWKGTEPFLSPMCGSGTPAIEAAMIAMNKAPGSLKGHFAFQSIKGYGRIIPGESAPTVAPRQRNGATPEQIWKEMVLTAKNLERTEGLPRIIATDISPEAVENAHSNAIAAGVAQFIEFKACDFADTPVPEEKGCVFFNPEYGIRLGDPQELAPIYERMGIFMNEKCRGYTGSVITGNPDLASKVNLEFKKRIPFFNGPIDCRLFIYEGCEMKGLNENGNK